MSSPNGHGYVPMLPVSDTSSSSRTRPFTSRSRSVSLSNTSSTIDVFENSTVVLGYTDPLGTQRRPQLVQMSDPISSTPRFSANSDSMLHNAQDDDAKGWARRFATSVDKYLPKIMTPEEFQRWTNLFAFSILLSIFVDPLFFFPIEVSKRGKCMKIDWRMAHILVALRTLTDVLFCVNILLQFRLAYVDPESTVVGSGELVKDPIKIARRYYRGNFLIDLFIVLPVPQILLVWIIPHVFGKGSADVIKNLLRTAVLIQCIPKLQRLFHLLAGKRQTGFIFESAWLSFFLNLFTFMLAGHVVGSCWYIFGLQRVNECLRDACIRFESNSTCKKLIDCSTDVSKNAALNWKDNANASACFREDGFHYGIYWKAVNLTHDSNLPKRYIYSLFWGFQQISTLAGNQVPSYFVWEVLFTMAIIGLGLFLFALLIGNMQNFLQSLSRRNMEMTLRRRDVNKWMSHRQFPDDIRTKVLEAERLNWSATRGVNEEFLVESMPDDLQRDIRRHLFAFLKKVGIFSEMDENILDAIREKLKQRIYLKGSMVLRRGDLVKNMVFIVTGEMVSTREDGSRTLLSEGNVCGEELLTWCQKRSSVNPDGTTLRMPSEELYSKRDVCCVKNVEAFSLSVADLEDVVALIPDSRDS
ncbi:hypothetical protein Rs2_24666 [Raphanus sativus]|nr:hypothetical protein Rs2_24666 [Raphanus sativus]